MSGTVLRVASTRALSSGGAISAVEAPAGVAGFEQVEIAIPGIGPECLWPGKCKILTADGKSSDEPAMA